MDDLEILNDKYKSINPSNNSVPTMYNTITEDQDDGSFNPSINRIDFDLIEWKKDIELSLEKIMERVSMGDCSEYLNLLEKKINEFDDELDNIKNLPDKIEEILADIKNNNNKTDRCDILLENVIGQFSEIKNINFNYQAECSKNFNELSDKIVSHEASFDQFYKFEKNFTKKFDLLNLEIKKKENSFIEIAEKNFMNKFLKFEEVKFLKKFFLFIKFLF